MAIIKKPILKTLFLLASFAGAISILIGGFYVSIPIADAGCWTIGGGSSRGGGYGGEGGGDYTSEEEGTLSISSSVVSVDIGAHYGSLAEAIADQMSNTLSEENISAMDDIEGALDAAAAAAEAAEAAGGYADVSGASAVGTGYGGASGFGVGVGVGGGDGSDGSGGGRGGEGCAGSEGNW